MNNSWLPKLISSGISAIVLLFSPSAFAESDRENLTRLQVKKNEIALELKSLQGRIRDISPTRWELQSLQLFIQESRCLTSGNNLIETSLPNREEFTMILDKCFTGLEKVASDRDRDRLIRINLKTLQALRSQSLPELVKLNSSYIGKSVLAQQQRILSAAFENDISTDDMRSLRYLMYKYPESIQDGYQASPCEQHSRSKILRQPINRREFAGALRSILDKLNELISIGMAAKIAKNDLSIATRLGAEFEGEMATYRGIGCALEGNFRLDLNTYLDAMSAEDLDYLS